MDGLINKMIHKKKRQILVSDEMWMELNQIKLQKRCRNMEEAIKAWHEKNMYLWLPKRNKEPLYRRKKK